MLELIFVSLALSGAAVASITDLKEGIIPNKISLTLLATGIIGHLAYNIYGLTTGTMDNLSLFILCIKNVAVIFAIGYIFWMMGGWAAGDVKEFMFLAALIPQYPLFLAKFFNPHFYPDASFTITLGNTIHRINILPYPFAITLLVNTFLAIFPFIFIYAGYVTITQLGISRMLEPLSEINDYVKKSIIFVGALVLITILGLPKILIILPLIILFLIEEKKAIALSSTPIILYILFGGQNIVSNLKNVLMNLIIIFLFLLIFDILWNSIKVLRKEALQKNIMITNLEEGMVIAEEIYRKDDKIIRDTRDLTEKIKEAIQKQDIDLLLKKPALIVNTTAAGIEESEIKTLQKMVKEGEIENRIRVKGAMPFAPIILLGLIISLTIGDLAYFISALI